MSKILGVGIDIVKISRFDRLLNSKKVNGSSFVLRLATRLLNEKHEYGRFLKLRESRNIVNEAKYLAGAWATKEALFKCLDPEDQKAFEFRQWYRFYDEQGKPHVQCDSYNKDNEQFHLSISHDEDHLIAYVLRERTK